MFCPNCGINNLEEAVFCENCGKRIVPAQQTEIKEPNDDSSKSAYATPDAGVYECTFPSQSVPRKPLSARAKIILVGLAAMAVLVIVYLCIGTILSNPQRIAESYFQQVSLNHYGKAYPYLHIEDSPFMNKELFAKANESAYPHIENYSVYESTYNASSYSSIRKNNKQGLTKSYTAEYIEKDAARVRYTTLTLVKQKEKRLLFFNCWEVSVPDMIVSNYTIQVQNGLTVYVDDVLLTDEYKTNGLLIDSADTYESSKSASTAYEKKAGYTYYLLDAVLSGDHTIKTKLNGITDTVTTVAINQNEKSCIINLKEDMADTAENLGTKAEKIMTAVYDAAMKTKEFSTISKYFITNMQDGVSYQYTSLINSFLRDWTDFKFTNLKGQIINTMDDSLITVQLDYTYEYTILDRNSENSGINNSYVKTDSGTKIFNFMKENGIWVMSSGSIHILYNY